MNLNFSEEDLKFKQEVRNFKNKNLNPNTKKKNRGRAPFNKRRYVRMAK